MKTLKHLYWLVWVVILVVALHGCDGSDNNNPTSPEISEEELVIPEGPEETPDEPFIPYDLPEVPDNMVNAAWSGNSVAFADTAERSYRNGAIGPGNGSCAAFVKDVLYRVTRRNPGAGWVRQSAYESRLKSIYGAQQVSTPQRGDILTMTWTSGVPHIAIVSSYNGRTLIVDEANHNGNHKIYLRYNATSYLRNARSYRFWRIGSNSSGSSGFDRYDNKNPTTMGCAGDAKTVGSANIYSNGTRIAYVELRWSNSCGTNWGRVTRYDGRKSESMRIEVQRSNPAKTVSGTLAGYNQIYSNMVYGRGFPARACATVRGLSACTGWR